MKDISKLEFHAGSKEELLPGFGSDFPYIASRAQMDSFPDGCAPWHWHKAVELFYLESGTLEYNTPKGKEVISAGAGGFVNSGVLHMTRSLSQEEPNAVFVHLFDPSFLAGEQGNWIEREYFIPIITDSQIELLVLDPRDERHAQILSLMQDAFHVSEQEFGYALKLREKLSNIWLLLWDILRPRIAQGIACAGAKGNERLQLMMAFVREHLSEKFSISDLAASAFLSERECFRMFRACLHVSPTEYIQNIRLQEACRLLAQTHKPVTAICQACGFGSSSYFSTVFRKYAHCTPIEYRRSRQDREQT